MGDEVKTIDNYAFSGCSHLNILLLSNNLKSIGAYAFSACMSLNSITLPASVAEISNNAFVGCDNLTIAVPKDSYAEQYCIDNGLDYTYL